MASKNRIKETSVTERIDDQVNFKKSSALESLAIIG